MRIAAIHENDIVNGENICVSLWFQGCPFKCKGCHNPETWDFNGGYEIEEQNLKNQILEALNKNNIQRNLSLLGGEPLMPNNYNFIYELTTAAKQNNPSIKIFLWTGHSTKNLINVPTEVLDNIDYIISEPFIIAQRDITLYWRGSSNQKILQHIDNTWQDITNKN